MNTAQPAKNLAQTIAKQIAQEPWEILKQGSRQITGVEGVQKGNEQGQKEVNDNSFEENQELILERDKVRSQRLMQALQVELDEIKKKKGEEKLLKAREVELAKEEKKNEEKPLIEPLTRKGRQLFNFGKKTQMQRQQTQTERPLPPSG